MTRKLVTIQNIKEISRIPDCDNIELAKVLGWQCVVKKGDFSVGDKCVYFEVDSFLPIEPRFEFLRNSSYKNNEYMGEGFRIKTQKFRGCISQGLCLPLNAISEAQGLDIGQDITSLLKVRKWDPPEVEGGLGTIVGDKPWYVHTTDEMRVQTLDCLREQLLGERYYISTKMDGTSCSMYYIDGEFGVCGRKSSLKNDGKSSMWRYAINNNIEEKMRAFGKNLVIQGEFCGHGIQKNRLKLSKPMWYIFNIFEVQKNTHNRLLPLDEMLEVVKVLGLTSVPIEEVGDNFNYTLPELLERAKGVYSSGMKKEGIVVRPVIPKYSKELGTFLSFKVLNNDFLLKN